MTLLFMVCVSLSERTMKMHACDVSCVCVVAIASKSRFDNDSDDDDDQRRRHHDHYHHCGNGTFIPPPVVGAEVILTLLFVKVEMQRRAERP